MSGTDKTNAFVIDDQKSFEENLLAFGHALVTDDPVLGTALSAALAELAAGTADKAAIWKSLQESATRSDSESGQPAEGKS